MDRLIELIGSRHEVPQMSTRASLINSYAIGSPVGDIQIIIWSKNHRSDVQETVQCKLRRRNERSRREIHFSAIEALRKRHRRSWLTCFACGTVISSDEISILARNVKVAFGIKHHVKGMVDPWIHFSVAFYEDLGKIVLSIFIKRALELQDFAIFEICVDHIQVLIRPEYESAKLTKFGSPGKTFFV